MIKDKKKNNFFRNKLEHIQDMDEFMKNTIQNIYEKKNEIDF